MFALSRNNYKKLAQLAGIPIAFIAFYHFQISKFADLFLTALADKPQVWISACLLAGFATVMRVKRTKIFLDLATPTSTVEQLRIWSAATVVNFFSPFRLGEIFRIFLLRRITNISLLYVVTAVALERLIDLVVIGLLFMVFTLGKENINPHSIFLNYLTTGMALALIVTICLLAFRNRRLFLLINRMISGASENTQWRFKHSLWVVIYGLQKFLHSKRTIYKYLLFTVASWGLYLTAVALLLKESIINLRNPILVIAPFLSLGSFSNQSVSAYLANIRGLFVDYQEVNTQATTLLLIGVWVALNSLTIIYGLVSLPRLNREMKSSPTTAGKINEKFLRSSQFGGDLKHLVDLYIENNEVVRELHTKELQGELRILKVFKGGSQAITALVQSRSGETYIDKSIANPFSAQLENQYRWLEEFKAVPEIVDTLGASRTANTYSIFLEYEEENQPFHRVMHYLDSAVNKEYVDQTLRALETNVYDLGPCIEQAELFDFYFQKRILARFEYALSQSSTLREISKEKTIQINGIMLDNLLPIIDKIFQRRELRLALSTFTTASHIHGDLTIDNILINQKQGKITIIDPSDDNEIVSPLIDYARMSQSLAGGYEFLNYLPTKSILIGANNSSIDYFDQRTAKYEELSRFLYERASSALAPSEFRSLDFHTASFFARMLPHRIRIDGGSVAIYYAKAVEFFNRFYSDQGWTDGAQK